ncbi:hypothetical protein EVAR_20617_1 [Eumeta japonica]|uniref:Uncharacterized protein n=1 Tax=Eumeta variegata TaxID=151549 RepID=A0A4C1UTV6_EUMVA|nr:hypothetical protein EVAR_20617_1 [Eumeta japonica]
MLTKYRIKGKRGREISVSQTSGIGARGEGRGDGARRDKQEPGRRRLHGHARPARSGAPADAASSSFRRLAGLARPSDRPVAARLRSRSAPRSHVYPFNAQFPYNLTLRSKGNFAKSFPAAAGAGRGAAQSERSNAGPN